MRIISKFWMVLLCTIAGLQISVVPALCQMQLNISDILRSPDRHYNQQVKFSGKVTNIESEGNSMSGSYMLVDKSNTGTHIISDILPLVGKSYEVTVVVYQSAESDKPLIREVSRKEKTRGYIGWIVGGALVIFAAMLVFQGSGDITGVEPDPIIGP